MSLSRFTICGKILALFQFGDATDELRHPSLHTVFEVRTYQNRVKGKTKLTGEPFLNAPGKIMHGWDLLRQSETIRTRFSRSRKLIQLSDIVDEGRNPTLNIVIKVITFYCQAHGKKKKLGRAFGKYIWIKQASTWSSISQRRSWVKSWKNQSTKTPISFTQWHVTEE